MRLTLPESNRSLLQVAECTFASVLAHAGVVIVAIAVTAGGRQLPTDEREARVFFLLPPDRVDVRARQTDILQWGRPGGDLEDGKLLRASEGMRVRVEAYGARAKGKKSGARGELPFGPVPYLVPDTVFSVLEVDKMVERYEGSAAPAYPPDLLAMGIGGLRARDVRGGHRWMGGHGHDRGHEQRRYPLHRIGPRRARRDAVPPGHAGGKSGSSAGRAEVPLPHPAAGWSERPGRLSVFLSVMSR